MILDFRKETKEDIAQGLAIWVLVIILLFSIENQKRLFKNQRPIKYISRDEFKLDFNDKSESDKKVIKKKIKSESKRKNTFAIIISILASIIAILVLKSITEGILFR